MPCALTVANPDGRVNRVALRVAADTSLESVSGGLLGLSRDAGWDRFCIEPGFACGVIIWIVRSFGWALHGVGCRNLRANDSHDLHLGLALTSGDWAGARRRMRWGSRSGGFVTFYRMSVTVHAGRADDH